MRIIHVIDDLNENAGGPAQACIEMSAAVARQGHQVAIYALGGRRPAWFPPDGRLPQSIRHDGVDVHLYPGRKDRWLGASRALYADLARAVPEADVVHVHVLYGFHLWAAWHLCRKLGVPLVVRPCGILNPYVSSVQHLGMRLIEAAFQNRLLQQASLIHFTTRQEALDAAEYTRNPRFAVIPLGLTLSTYRQLPARSAFDARYPEAHGRKVVLFFGRLHRKKRLDLVIGAFAAMVRAGHDLHLMIAGPDDGMEAQCRALVRDHGLSDRTTFAGMVVNDTKRTVFGGADFFVLPSMSENFGIAVTEAAASGIPLLLSEHVNTASLFQREDAAVVVPAELTCVTRGLDYLVNYPGRSESMAIRARRVVEQNFSWEHVAGQLEGMYRQMAISRQRNAAPGVNRPRIHKPLARDGVASAHGRVKADQP